MHGVPDRVAIGDSHVFDKMCAGFHSSAKIVCCEQEEKTRIFDLSDRSEANLELHHRFNLQRRCRFIALRNGVHTSEAIGSAANGDRVVFAVDRIGECGSADGR